MFTVAFVIRECLLLPFLMSAIINLLMEIYFLQTIRVGY